MSGTGRPLRFLAAVSGGWVMLRVALLWPEIDAVQALTKALVPVAIAKPALNDAMMGKHARPPTVPMMQPGRTRPATELPRRSASDPTRVALALLGLMRFGSTRDHDAPPGIVAGLPRPAITTSPTSGLGVSAWLFLRDGSGAGQALVGGQLGGSQAGVRLTYALRRQLALAARLSTPLAGPGRELAAGIEWRPTPLPVRLVAERRVSLDGGQGGTVLGAVGGFGPQHLAHGVRADAYGQAGYILRGGGEAFGDGALRLSHDVATFAKLRFDLGAGAWGAAQRGAARLDIGPSFSAILPIVGGATRLSLDWRQRVAGQALPGSGLVMTLGTDF